MTTERLPIPTHISPAEHGYDPALYAEEMAAADAHHALVAAEKEMGRAFRTERAGIAQEYRDERQAVINDVVTGAKELAVLKATPEDVQGVAEREQVARLEDQLPAGVKTHADRLSKGFAKREEIHGKVQDKIERLEQEVESRQARADKLGIAADTTDLEGRIAQLRGSLDKDKKLEKGVISRTSKKLNDAAEEEFLTFRETKQGERLQEMDSFDFWGFEEGEKPAKVERKTPAETDRDRENAVLPPAPDAGTPKPGLFDETEEPVDDFDEAPLDLRWRDNDGLEGGIIPPVGETPEAPAPSFEDGDSVDMPEPLPPVSPPAPEVDGDLDPDEPIQWGDDHHAVIDEPSPWDVPAEEVPDPPRVDWEGNRGVVAEPRPWGAAPEGNDGDEDWGFGDGDGLLGGTVPISELRGSDDEPVPAERPDPGHDPDLDPDVRARIGDGGIVVGTPAAEAVAEPEPAPAPEQAEVISPEEQFMASALADIDQKLEELRRQSEQQFNDFVSAPQDGLADLMARVGEEFGQQFTEGDYPELFEAFQQQVRDVIQRIASGEARPQQPAEQPATSERQNRRRRGIFRKVGRQAVSWLQGLNPVDPELNRLNPRDDN